MEKEIGESTVARLFLDLIKGQIANANKRHNIKFSPKYREFVFSRVKLRML